MSFSFCLQPVPYPLTMDHSIMFSPSYLYKPYSLLALLLVLFISLPALAQKRLFSDTRLINEAKKLSITLKHKAKTNDRSYQAMDWKGRIALKKGSNREALTYFKIAAGKTDNAQIWINLSKTWLLLKTQNYRERTDFPQYASAAAYKAFTHASNNAEEATSLRLIGRALERRSLWRSAMAAYKASLIRKSSKQVAALYQDLKNRHGFRITNYKVDSDSLTPRLCIEFSEILDKDQRDYRKFIRLESRKPAAITSEGNQICIDGLEHGNRYRATVRSGILSKIGDRLEKSSDLSVYVKDRSPALRFSGKNYVLPRGGQQGIPLTSVNLDKADIDLYRIGERALSQTFTKPDYDKKLFGRQLTTKDFDKIKNGLGQHIWRKSLIIHKVLNKDSQTAIPIGSEIASLQNTLAPGLYVLRAGVPDKDYNRWDDRATQWFIISDLGLTAFSGNDGIHTFVRAIGSALPLKGIEIQLTAKNNEILGTATTDQNGYATFSAGLTRGEGGQRPAMVTARQGNHDYAFLDLTSTAFDLSDRGVSGRKAPGPIDSYLFTERGVYRPGATVHLVALARDQKTQALQNMPFTLVIERPDGVEYKRQLLKDEGLGGHSFDLKLPKSVQTGSWRAKLYHNVKEDPVADSRFLVEDFEPEKLKLTLNSQNKLISKNRASNRTVTLSAEGAYLYGAPASNMALEAEIAISKTSRPRKGFKGYHFGMEKETFHTVRKTFASLPNTDKDGNALVSLILPDLNDTSKMLQANVTMRLRESSGRTIERAITLPVAPQKPAIGIKPLFKTAPEEGEQAGFHIAVMNIDGKQMDYKDLYWEISHIERNYQWYTRNGSWRYEPFNKTRRIANGRFDAKKSKAIKLSSQIKWGNYRLDVYSKDGNNLASSYNFRAGWYQESSDSDTPDLLDIGLDKKQYKVGDSLNVRIKPRSAGKVLVTVLNGGLIDKKLVDMPKGGGNVTFTVSEKWGAGAYVAASLYRPMNTAAKRMPSRSVGIEWVTIGKAKRSLDIELSTAKMLRSNSKLSVPMTIKNALPGEKVYVVASAVDVGILNLTGYKAPAPEDHFYAKRQLNVEMRDLYGRLIDGMQSVKGKLRSGGDGMALGSYGITGSPPAQKPLSRFSGIKQVQKDGTISIDFDIPDFAGTVKVMTVAWSKNRVGHSEKDVIIRDKLVMTATTPKFMNVGDQSRLHIEVDNIDGMAGNYTLNLVSGGAVLFNGSKLFSQTIPLKEKQRKSWNIPLEAALKGTGFISAELTGPDDTLVKRSYEFAVTPPHPDVTTQSVSTIAPEGSISLSKDLLVNLAKGSGHITLAVAPSYLPDIPGLLMSLDRYPYGCTEQLTSRAMPLLYLSSVAAQIGMEDHKKLELRQRVQKAIDKIISRQNSEGAFGLWSATDGGLWLTSFATDFLTRAKEKRYNVPQKAFKLALENLSNTVSYSSTISDGGEGLAYALYVLARNKKARIGDLRYYADEKITSFKTPLAMSQIGAALAMYGDPKRANAAFLNATNRIKGRRLVIGRSNNFGSDLRDSAAMIALISEVGVGSGLVQDLSHILAQSNTSATTTTTQEKGWLLLAANALYNETQNFSVALNGQNQQGSLFKTLTAQQLIEGDFTLKNTGSAPAKVTITLTGTPINAEPATMNGLEIEREYFSLNGKKRDLSNVKQNERLVVVLSVHELKGLPAELMVTDYIPAGFEIENPRLVKSSQTGKLSWIANSKASPVHSQFRNNRFTAAFTLKTSKLSRSLTMAYIVRAVSPGRYSLPPAIAEDMYRPSRIGRTKSAKLAIE